MGLSTKLGKSSWRASEDDLSPTQDDDLVGKELNVLSEMRAEHNEAVRSKSGNKSAQLHPMLRVHTNCWLI